MISIRKEEDLRIQLKELLKLPNETEWVEFKQNKCEPEEIGEYISALSNSAALVGKESSFMVWGIDDATHEIVGTSFQPARLKIGNTELETWLLQHLSPRINFVFKELTVDGKSVVILEIDAAARHPVKFKHVEYFRIGSSKRKLNEFPEKERELWRTFDRVVFEKEIAIENVNSSEILQILDTPPYFDLLGLPYPDNRQGILNALEAEQLIVPYNDQWSITNLGLLLFAKRLDVHSHLKRKAVRVVLYEGKSRVKTIREQQGNLGYANGFTALCSFIEAVLPVNEVIEKALRKQVPMFPPLAVRELMANAIIHQDFYLTGTSPMVEIFSDRMEITNPGVPIVKTERFLDNPPRSRNEILASLMRRFGICEERGSGIDKVVSQTELYQLPAPLFEAASDFTRVVLFAHKDLEEMDKEDKVRACYLHACLRYVNRDFMTNTSLRERFGIDQKNSAIVSRIIRETLEANLIRPQDADSGPKFKKYIPFWA